MRKLLSHLMLMLVMAALAAPSVSAQYAVKHGAKATRSQAQKLALDKRTKSLQMLIRSDKNGYSTNMRREWKGALGRPVVSTREQMRQATGGVELYGNVIYSEYVDEDYRAHTGIWRFDTEGNFLQGYPANIGTCYAAVCLDGIYHNYYAMFAYDEVFPYYEAFDVTTWQGVVRPVSEISIENIPISLCTDGTNVYGQRISPNNGFFSYGKFDVNTNTWTDITDMEQKWNACAYGNDGFIYAVDMLGDCYKVTPATGAATKLGFTGAIPKYTSGATIDKKSGRMFWTVSPEEGGYLYEVNTTTGVATKLCQFEYGDEVAGLFVPFVAADEAPAAVENLQINFPNGSLSGTVDFTCPTTLYNGTAATGALTYTVMLNGSVVKIDECSFGQQVSAPISVEAAGKATFRVYVSNEAGEGPKTNVEQFIGKDTPKPTTVTIEYADGKFNVNWEAVTTTANGGYMDLSKVNYTVTRYPDNVVVGANVTGTSLQDPVSKPDTFTKYYYTVVVNCDGLSSSAATSNIVSLGELKPPYTQSFDSEEVLEDFAIIDANHDDATWHFNSTEGQNTVRCKYHSTNTMDDWLITPSFRLEAGKTYRVAFDSRVLWDDEFIERIEMKMGNAPTAEAMTVSVIPATEITASAWVTLEAFITPETTGNYNFGMHGVSDPDQYYLYVDNFTISEPMDGGAPGLATGLTVKSDPTGALKATISGQAPTISLGGQNLTSNITKIELVRDGNVVSTAQNIALGANFSLVDDTPSASGTYSWSVICYNDKGVGQEANVSGFVGVDKPGPVTNIQVTENPTGTVTVTWDAPTVDVHGTPLGATPITYTILDVEDPSITIASNLTTTSYTFKAVEDGTQEFVQVGIFAISELGFSEGEVSPLKAIGTPYQAPWAESFPNKTLSTLLGLSREAGDGAQWAIKTDGDLDLNSYDNDGGYIAGQFSSPDDATILFSGKIDLANTENPEFSFYTFNLIDEDGGRDINEIEVLVREANASDWTVLKSGTVDALCNGNADEWNRISVNLNAYKGKAIQIGIKAVCKYYAYIFLDKLEVGHRLQHNLGLVSINAPETTAPNTEFSVTAYVENSGANAAEGYTVSFYRNDESAPFKTFTGTTLAPGARKAYSTQATLGYAEDDASARYHAVVTYAADMRAADDTSDEVTVQRKYSDKPAPTNLTGVTEGNRVSLTWTAPELAQRHATGTLDDLESYDAWAYENVGEWTFVDADKSPMGWFQYNPIPGSDGYSLRSFIVFQWDDAAGFNDTFAGHSGTKCFGSMFCADGSQNNDWVITPMLSGNAQTVSFWAKSYNSNYPEALEILYSTTGTDIADFISIRSVNEVPGEWTEYTADLPAGAKYFAVRNCSWDCLLLMLDDFTFEAIPNEVVGYNVYRDNVKLNTELITGTSFVDENCPTEGNPGYVVTAVYASGVETAPTNVFWARGVEAIDASITVEAGDGYIAIAGAEGKPVSITAINGIRYFNRVADGEIRIELAAGIYLVRVANGTAKVVVK